MDYETKTEPVPVPPLHTERLNASRPEDISRAAQILREGGIVAFPTETVYGLGANALDPVAIAKIFAAKQRPSWDPLIVHINDQAMLYQVAALLEQPQNAVILSAAKDVSSAPLTVLPKVKTLTETFWPGPLTLLLPRTTLIPDAVTAGRPLVGVRMPAHPVALSLIRQAGIPIAAPSANRFGHTSPTTASHVLADLDGRIDAVLDAGPTHVGLESTVLDPTQWPMILYRQGAVSLENIHAIFGRESAHLFIPPVTETEPSSLPSPGVSLRHYAPNARLILVPVPAGLFDPRDSLVETVESLPPSETIGLLLPTGWNPSRAPHTFNWGYWDNPKILAHNLFAGLRDLDNAGATIIIAPIPNGPGLPAAIRDRLQKAARP